ncbi:MAG: 4'-phosphopantetheinyl transferase superfamily protein [Sulfitobacter sp.]
MTPVPGLEAALRSQLGGQISVALADPKAPTGRLFPAEAAAMAAATPKRLSEFTAGRGAARRALAAIGVDPQPILHAPDRAPIWPAGVTGSITHCDILCLSAVARTDTIRSLGIDLEPDADLPRDLEDIVCTSAERGWLDSHPADRRGTLAKLIFCAKESAYKAQYPLTQSLFGFETFEITLDPEAGQFTATFQNPVGGFAAGDVLQGRFLRQQGLIFTSVVIPHSDSPVFG